MLPTIDSYLRKAVLQRERVVDLSKYPFCVAALRNLVELEFHPKVTFIVGENGSGKSTLLEAVAVACGFNPEGGSKGFQFSTRASHSELYNCLRLVRSIRRPRDGFFFRAESYFNLATDIEVMDSTESNSRKIIDSYGGRSLHEQSHGESFFSLLTHRFGGSGLYLLDEPEAALSPSKQIAAILRIHQLVRRASQFVIATHSPILLAYPDAKILQIGKEGLTEVKYEDTDHYITTKSFLDNPGRSLKLLLSDEEHE